MQHEALYHQVLSLPPIDRARLVETILQSFNSEPTYQKELDAAWSHEVNERWEAYQAKEMNAAPAQDVLTRIEQKLS